MRGSNMVYPISKLCIPLIFHTISSFSFALKILLGTYFVLCHASHGQLRDELKYTLCPGEANGQEEAIGTSELRIQCHCCCTDAWTSPVGSQKRMQVTPCVGASQRSMQCRLVQVRRISVRGKHGGRSFACRCMEDSWRQWLERRVPRKRGQSWEWNVGRRQHGKNLEPCVCIFCRRKEKHCPFGHLRLCVGSSGRPCRSGQGIEGYFPSFTQTVAVETEEFSLLVFTSISLSTTNIYAASGGKWVPQTVTGRRYRGYSKDAVLGALCLQFKMETHKKD